MEKKELYVDSGMEELYKIKEANSLRYINMTTKEIQEDLKGSVEEFNKLIEQARNSKRLAVR